MLRTLLLTVASASIGAFLAESLGAILGVLVGFGVGCLWLAFTPELRLPAPPAPGTRTVEHVRCNPRGAAADCTFVRDARSGRYLDVARCDLESGAPRCAKGCLEVLNGPLVAKPRAAAPA